MPSPGAAAVYFQQLATKTDYQQCGSSSRAAAADGKAQRQLVHEIAKDLELMVQDQAPLKKNLTVLKKKWQLSSRITGREVTAKVAFHAVHAELHSLHQMELRSLQQLEANAEFMVPLAASSNEIALAKLPQQTLAVVGVAACASAAFAAWRLLAWMKTSVDMVEPIHSESVCEIVQAASSTGATVHSPGLDGDDCGGSQKLGNATSCLLFNSSEDEEKSVGSSDFCQDTTSRSICRTIDAARTCPAETSTISRSGGSGHWKVVTQCLASIAVLTGLAVGAWWLLGTSRDARIAFVDSSGAADVVEVPRQLPLAPEPVENEGPTAVVEHVTSVELTTSPLAQKASSMNVSETIFENSPTESQVWDMSASIRGVPGRVKNRIREFE